MSVELSQEQIKNVLQGITIPPQPQVMVDLHMEQVMPNPDISTIAKLISQDVGLAGSVLKTVNSAFFGLKSKITSIQQAVSLLGFQSVINIVNALSIRGELSDEAIVALNRFWDTAMDIAMACTTIAKQIGFESPDEAYTLGLFHNCGIPLLMQRFDNYMNVMEQAYAHEGERVIDVENRELKTNHAVVGYYVAKSWNLPIYLCEAIAEHHNVIRIFKEKETDNLRKKNMLAILKIAEHICGNFHILGGQDIDHEWEAVKDNLLVYAGLSEYDLQNLKDNCIEMGINSAQFSE